MLFGKKKNWDDQYDEDYAARADRRERLAHSAIWRQLGGFFAIIAGLLVAIGMLFGMTILENMLKALATPVGLVWLLLLFLTYLAFLFRQGMLATISIFTWLILTIGGNSFVANQLAYGLEKSHLTTNWHDLAEMDAVVLLGGGTRTNLQGRAQTSSAGDRVVTAARLYISGKTNLIVCTGEQVFRTDPNDMQPHEEASRILKSLNIPPTDVVMLKGANTSEEMQNVALFLQQQKMFDAKIGIVSSAWHLNRVGRLARKNGLDPVLIPADFHSTFFTNSPNLLIPSADHLATSARCATEKLAGLVGR